MTTVLILAATALPFVISPGASFTITLGAVAAGDRRGPVKVWAGTSLGAGLIASVAAVTGLGTFIANNATANLVFGVLGGSLLIAFGVVPALRLYWRRRNGGNGTEPQQKRLVLWSFLVVITNVKALSIYAIVVPTIPQDALSGAALYASFTGIHSVLILLWLSLLGLAVRNVPGLARSPRAQGILVLAASFTMVVLGVRTIMGAFM